MKFNPHFCNNWIKEYLSKYGLFFMNHLMAFHKLFLASLVAVAEINSFNSNVLLQSAMVSLKDNIILLAIYMLTI